MLDEDSLDLPIYRIGTRRPRSPRFMPLRIFGFFPEMPLPPPPPSAPQVIVRTPDPEVEMGRRRRKRLVGKVFGCLRVVRCEGVVGETRGPRRPAKAVWRAVCAPDLGGCGGEVVGRSEYLERRGHCGCRRGRIYEFGGRKLTVEGWARELTRRGGVHISAWGMRWRIKTWGIERALSVRVNRRAA
jgi:hypothetical protein